MISLKLPLEQINITQYFGQNFVDFYAKLGLKGHNGIDFSAKHGCKTYATHDGLISLETDADGGKGVNILDYTNLFKTIHYHVCEFTVENGQMVKAGDLIALCDNTGSMTTGDHLHYGLKLMDKNGNTLNKDNGYKGAIDPSPYFFYRHDGVEIKNKDWDKPRAYHRYFRPDVKINLINKAKTAAYLAIKLGHYPSTVENNAAIWGGWDWQTITNDSMYDIFSQLKKDEFLNKQQPFK
jgi:murein DD-endopeptidase MepM/ murein hydrolase activator NlpD